MSTAGAAPLVVVRVGGERFAIGTDEVEEVVEAPVVAALPGLPGHAAGVLRHRGDWLAAIDAAPLLGLSRGEDARPGAALLMRRGRARFALVVDAVVRVMERPGAAQRLARGAGGQGGGAEDEPLLQDEEGVVALLRPAELFRSGPPESVQEVRMPQLQATAGAVPIVTFRLGPDEFGIDVQQVQEVLPFEEPRPVPHAPDFIEGVLDVRGTIVPVVDLRKRFELPARRRDANTRVLLVAAGEERVGVIVDAVMEVVRMPPTDIAEPPSLFRGLAARYIAGLARRPHGVLILLHADRILTSEERLALLGAGDEAAATAVEGPERPRTPAAHAAREDGSSTPGDEAAPPPEGRARARRRTR